ncbi:putative nucleic acid-binding protein [Methylorubrum rhodinum]|uniref:Ribonuclease VapC n=1 Tax=Methylorubrum rhodinum TaxID=29428 RepID=A0A840ZKY5_9HYPH|nr:PIN domain-containing protein [Methylorubrum rhodinum]MBB5758762.1 putative nucleic acid-binding protein [Methylorubrum rhodinum]
MTGLLFFDTNLLIYAMDPRDPTRRAASMALIGQARTLRRLVVSPQILNECYRVLVHRLRLADAPSAARYLSAFHGACTAPLDVDTHRSAIELEARHGLSWWDSLAVASALQARCDHFVSEDLNDGQAIEALTVVNPFTWNARARLALI